MRLITPSFPSNSFGCRDLNAVTTDTDCCESLPLCPAVSG
jgi:hypothetical protein